MVSWAPTFCLGAEAAFRGFASERHTDALAPNAVHRPNLLRAGPATAFTTAPQAGGPASRRSDRWAPFQDVPLAGPWALREADAPIAEALWFKCQ